MGVYAAYVRPRPAGGPPRPLLSVRDAYPSRPCILYVAVQPQYKLLKTLHGSMLGAKGEGEGPPQKAGDGLSPARPKKREVPPPAPISGRSWIRSPEGPSKKELEKDPIAGDFGLYFQLKIKKLKEQYQEGVDNDLITGEVSQPGKWASQLFRGVKIWVNGHTRPSHHELKRLMTLHGGVFENYYLASSGVTHIICSNLPDSKYTDFRHGRGRPPVLKPEWITDSIAANKLLPVGPYEHTRIKHDPGQSVLSKTLVSLGASHMPLLTGKETPPLGIEESSRLLAITSGVSTETDGEILSNEQPALQLENGNASDVNASAGKTPKRDSNESAERRVEGGADSAVHFLREGLEVSTERREDGIQAEALHCYESPNGLSPIGLHQERLSNEEGARREMGSDDKHIGPAEKELPALKRLREEGSQDGIANGEREGRRAAKRARLEDGTSTRDQLLLRNKNDGAERVDEVLGGQFAEQDSRANVFQHDRTERMGLDAGERGHVTTDRTGKQEGQQGSALPTSSEADKSRSEMALQSASKSSKPSASNASPPPKHVPSHSLSPARRPPPPGPNGYRSPSGARSHSTKDDPDFINSFYKNSRLHFIGTWRTRYQAMGGSDHWRKEGGAPELPKEGHPLTEKERLIVHIDMDCFFVNVIVRDRPELSGKAVAVSWGQGANAGTAEISSANYKARDFGVRAGMFVREAKRRCPELMIVNYDFAAYEEVADTLYKLLHQTSSRVQAVSCDEAFLDISGCPDSFELVSGLRARIFSETGCTASAGIAHNLLLARMATRKAKPNGQHHITVGQVSEYMADLPVGKLPGVGWSLEERLRVAGIHTCADVRKLSREALQRDYGGKTGDMLFSYARGIDIKELEPNQKRKSVGAECNWGIRFSSDEEALKFTATLASEVCNRLSEAGVRGSVFTLKIKKRKAGAGDPIKFMGCGICDNLSRSITLPQATGDVSIVERLAKQLYHAMAVPPKEIRGVGIGVTRLEDEGGKLFRGGAISDWLEKKKEGQDLESVNKQAEPAVSVHKDRSLDASRQTSFDNVNRGLEQVQDDVNKHSSSTIEDRSLHGESINTSPTKDSTQKQRRLQEIKAGKAKAEDLPLEPPPPSITEASLSLPPQTEIDPSVLAELPDEIRAEIVQAYKQSETIGAGVKDISKSERKVGPSSIGKASTSGGSGIRKESKQSERGKGSKTGVEQKAVAESSKAGSKEVSFAAPQNSECLALVVSPAKTDDEKKGAAGLHSPIRALPPMAQIDRSVLDALPLIMRRELERAYEMQTGGRPMLPVKRKLGPLRLNAKPSRSTKQARNSKQAPSVPYRPPPKAASSVPNHLPTKPASSDSVPQANALVLTLPLPPLEEKPPKLETPEPTLTDLWLGDPPKWMQLCVAGLDVLQPLMDVYAQDPRGEELGLADALQGMAQGGVLPILASQSGSPPLGSALLKLQCTPPLGGEQKAKVEMLNQEPVEAYAAVVMQYADNNIGGGLEEVHRLLKMLKRLAGKWSFWGAILKRAESHIQDKVKSVYGGCLRT